MKNVLSHLFVFTILHTDSQHMDWSIQGNSHTKYDRKFGSDNRCKM